MYRQRTTAATQTNNIAHTAVAVVGGDDKGNVTTSTSISTLSSRLSLSTKTTKFDDKPAVVAHNYHHHHAATVVPATTEIVIAPRTTKMTTSMMSAFENTASETVAVDF